MLNTTTSPPRVELALASGDWPDGTLIQRMDDSEKRDQGAGPAEDAIHAGAHL